MSSYPFSTKATGRITCPSWSASSRAFKNEPHIFAWEIGKELKYLPEPPLFSRFCRDVSDKIRTWDSNHLITSGVISSRNAGFFSEPDKIAFYNPPNIDFMTTHNYNGENLEDDTALIRLVHKPLIIEEAGFDAPAGEDWSPKVRDDLQKWFGQGASGYMQRGFMATPDNRGGDRNSGMDRAFHTDWYQLFALYQQKAQTL